MHSLFRSSILAVVALLLLATTASGQTSDISVTVTLTGAGSAIQTVIGGRGSAAVLLNVPGTSTIVAEVSADGGTTWEQVDVFDPSAGTVAATMSATGTFGFAWVGGVSHARVRATALSGGNVTGTLRVTSAQTTPRDVNLIPGQRGVAAGAGASGANVVRVVLSSDSTVTTTDSGTAVNVAAWNGVAVTGGAGAVGAGSPRVTLGSDDPAVASLSVLDDWDETNRGAVNTIAGQVGVQGGAGVVTALTQRVSVATDDVVSVNDNAGTLTVDAPVGAPVAARISTGVAFNPTGIGTSVDALRIALPTDGTITIGAEIPAGTKNIGDVDVLTINGQAPDFNAGATGAATLRSESNLGRWIGSTAPTVGQKAAASSLPVVAASDATPPVTAVGAVAPDAPVSGNPLLVGGRASDVSAAVPTAVSASGNAVRDWRSLSGASVVTGQVVAFTTRDATTADQQGVAAATGLRLAGFAMRETAGTAAVATVLLRHGTTATDPIIAAVELSANESAREWWWPGLDVPNGVFLDMVAGEAQVTVYHNTQR